MRYTQLMQERNMVLTQEDLLQELQEASRLAGAVYTSGSPLGRSVSSVGERQSDGYESPSLPKERIVNKKIIFTFLFFFLL